MKKDSTATKLDLNEGIFDARTLGVPKMLLLGFQHMFAMFGATVLVPLLTGLDIYHPVYGRPWHPAVPPYY